MGDEGVIGGEDEAAGAVFAVAAEFVVLEDAEGFGGIVRAHHVPGVEHIAELVTAEAIGEGIPGIELGAELGAVGFIPGEGRAVMAEIAGEGGHGVAGVGEFQHARDDEGERGFVVGARGENRLLVENTKRIVYTANLQSSYKITNQ